MKSKNRIMFGVYGMILAMIGDYLMGFGTTIKSDGPDAILGMAVVVVPDWRYAVSSVLGFLCVAMYAYAAVEVFRVMEDEYHLSDAKLYNLFKIANWSGILYFAFVHIALCMLPVVYNAGMEITGDPSSSMQMVMRVTKSIAVPLIVTYIVSDLFVTIAWVGMVLKGMIPVRKILFICNPLIIALLGNIMNLIAQGLDSGFESFGWLLMYLVCAICLTKGETRKERAI